MNDEELEALLRRYRPAGPSADLRERMSMEAGDSRRAWPWAAAAAALLACSVALQASAGDLRSQLPGAAAPSAQGVENDVLRAAFGLDEDTARAVQLATELQQQRELAVSSGVSIRP